jgi:hypothetical protein
MEHTLTTDHAAVATAIREALDPDAPLTLAGISDGTDWDSRLRWFFEAIPARTFTITLRHGIELDVCPTLYGHPTVDGDWFVDLSASVRRDSDSPAMTINLARLRATDVATELPAFLDDPEAATEADIYEAAVTWGLRRVVDGVTRMYSTFAGY